MSILIARVDSYTKAGRYVSRGQPIDSSEIDENSGNFVEAPEGYNENAVVEVSAISPTGPNPRNPQQIAPDVVQTAGGYVQSGATLVGEVTLPEKQRIEVVGIDPEDTTQADVEEALAKADQNVSNEGTEGTVADISARAADMDAAALDQLERAENDREVPRKGVMAAIERRRGELEA